MNIKSIKLTLSLFVAVCLIIGAAGNVYGETYPALKGVEKIKAVVDFRISNAKMAAIHLDLYHKTYNDKHLTDITPKPEFVIVFIGPSVKLISKSREGVSAEEAKHLDAIAGTLVKMRNDGIKLEVCVAAVELLGVDPTTILPGIRPVPNGWISSIGYQHNGYALLPDF